MPSLVLCFYSFCPVTIVVILVQYMLGVRQRVLAVCHRIQRRLFFSSHAATTFLSVNITYFQHIPHHLVKCNYATTFYAGKPPTTCFSYAGWSRLCRLDPSPHLEFREKLSQIIFVFTPISVRFHDRFGKIHALIVLFDHLLGTFEREAPNLKFRHVVFWGSFFIEHGEP